MLLKITEKIIRKNAFEQKRKKTWVKFNLGLSANWTSNNWTQKFKVQGGLGWQPWHIIFYSLHEYFYQFYLLSTAQVKDIAPYPDP